MIADLAESGQQTEQICLICDTPDGGIRYQISEGSGSHLRVDPAEVLRWALGSQATWLFVLHTHSVPTPPSVQDHAWTRRMRAAASLVGVEFRGHVVVYPDRSLQTCDGSQRAS